MSDGKQYKIANIEQATGAAAEKYRNTKDWRQIFKPFADTFNKAIVESWLNVPATKLIQTKEVCGKFSFGKIQYSIES